MSAEAFQLSEHFLSLDGRGAVKHHDGGAKFWSDMVAQNILGTLVSFGESQSDWPHWEMHPKGDEIVFLVEGEVTLILEERDERVRLKTHDSFVIPAGAWHRALIHTPSKMMFVTYGEGTRHKPVAP